MADTDWSGLLGTVIIGGIAVKMTQGMFGNSSVEQNEKKKKKKLTTSKQYFNSPW
jgi:hypothetical protein